MKVEMDFKSIKKGEYPPKDDYYIIISEDALDPDNVMFTKMWWDGEHKLWYSTKEKRTAGFVPVEYWGDWWCKPCGDGLKNR